MDLYILSRKIIKSKEKFAGIMEYDEAAAKIYFDEILTHIHDYFLQTNRTKYFYCSMGVIDDGKVFLLPYKYNEPQLGAYHKKLMQNLVDTINEQGSISITKMFLHPDTIDEHYKAVLYKDNKSVEKLDEFIYVDLKKLKWNRAGSHARFEKIQYENFSFYKHFVRQKNASSSKRNPFDVITKGRPSKEEKVQFNKLIALFAEIASGMKSSCHFYFLKPVTFKNHYSVVFLLGLRKSLTPNEIETWLNVTRFALESIADKKEEELNRQKAKLVFKAGVSDSTFHLGHFLKNRFSVSKGNLLKQKEEIDKFVHDKTALSNLLSSAIIDVGRGENIGRMLNLISLLEYQDENTVFNRIAKLKPKNYSEYIETLKHYELAGSIKSIRDYLDFQGCNVNINGIEDLNSLGVKNINGQESETFRPQNFFYDEILLELFLNAFNHSDYDLDNPRYRSFVLAYDPSKSGIILTNSITQEKFEDNKHNLQQENDNWMDPFFSTGLYNYKQILTLTKTGDIKVKVTDEGNKFTFKVLLVLNGLFQVSK